MTSQEIILRFREGHTRKSEGSVEIDRESGEVIVDGNNEERLSLDDLKAIFFLGPAPEATRSGTRIHVKFQDGEELHGLAPEYNPSNRGFVMYPIDSDRIGSVFVVTSAVESIEVEHF